MENPFQKIDARLNNLESLILDIKHDILPRILKHENTTELNIVDLDGLLKSRPFIGSRSTIYKKVSSGLIPHSKNGKRLIFDLARIDEWLLSNKIPTTKELEMQVNQNLQDRKRKGGKGASF